MNITSNIDFSVRISSVQACVAQRHGEWILFESELKTEHERAVKATLAEQKERFQQAIAPLKFRSHGA